MSNSPRIILDLKPYLHEAENTFHLEEYFWITNRDLLLIKRPSFRCPQDMSEDRGRTIRHREFFRDSSFLESADAAGYWKLVAVNMDGGPDLNVASFNERGKNFLRCSPVSRLEGPRYPLISPDGRWLSWTMWKRDGARAWNCCVVASLDGQFSHVSPERHLFLPWTPVLRDGKTWITFNLCLTSGAPPVLADAVNLLDTPYPNAYRDFLEGARMRNAADFAVDGICQTWVSQAVLRNIGHPEQERVVNFANLPCVPFFGISSENHLLFSNRTNVSSPDFRELGIEFWQVPLDDDGGNASMDFVALPEGREMADVILSPDGTRIGWMLVKADSRPITCELWVSNLLGDRFQQIVVLPQTLELQNYPPLAGDIRLAWKPDGSELTYLSEGCLWAVEVE